VPVTNVNERGQIVPGTALKGHTILRGRRIDDLSILADCKFAEKEFRDLGRKIHLRI